MTKRPSAACMQAPLPTPLDIASLRANGRAPKSARAASVVRWLLALRKLPLVEQRRHLRSRRGRKRVGEGCMLLEHGRLTSGQILELVMIARRGITAGRDDFGPFVRAIVCARAQLSPAQWHRLLVNVRQRCEPRDQSLHEYVDRKVSKPDQHALALMLSLIDAMPYWFSARRERDELACRYYLAQEEVLFAGLRACLPHAAHAALLRVERGLAALAEPGNEHLLAALCRREVRSRDPDLRVVATFASVLESRPVSFPLVVEALAELEPLASRPFRGDEPTPAGERRIFARLRTAFRHQYPALVERVGRDRPSNLPTILVEGPVLRVTHPSLGEAAAVASPFHVTIVDAPEHGTFGYGRVSQTKAPPIDLINTPRIVDGLVDSLFHRWEPERFPSLPSEWVGKPIVAVLFPELRLKKARGLARGFVARCITKPVQEWARALQAADAPAFALHRKAFHALGYVPKFLTEPLFFDLASPQLKADLFRYRVAWAAVSAMSVLCTECSDRAGGCEACPERVLGCAACAYAPDGCCAACSPLSRGSLVADDSPELWQERIRTTMPLLEQWMLYFAPPGAEKVPKSTRKLLMNWPAGLSAYYARALVGAHVEWQPRSYLEVLYAIVLPHCLPRFDNHPNAELLRRATDEEIRAVFARARTELPDLIAGRTVRAVRKHRILARYILDDPRPYGGRLPGLYARARAWHDELARRPRVAVATPAIPSSFPPLPATLASPDKATLEHIATLERLQREGEEMRHCVASYAASAATGELFLFHVRVDQHRATVETDPGGTVLQAYGPMNTSNPASRWAWNQRRLFGAPLPASAVPGP